MKNAKPLPTYLVQRYHGWKATTYESNQAWYRRLSDDGQHPRAMVIACCDSRVHVTSIFGADQGEFFIHRNISSLVPPYQPDGQQHGTSAAVEFAVAVLKVGHLIVMGHSNCGGIQGCIDMCSGAAPELDEKTNFTGRWMDILRPGYKRVKDLPREEQNTALEKEAVLVSIENLMTFPFVAEAVKNGRLTLHALWNDVGEGILENYVPETGKFQPI
ncbi:carbonic anhydrase [Aquicoccus sp. G2-2]|jgi:carbonic anhydrase|uniref:carbonic anhydrase n=1 Tax=Aquicoccus sp. G2-2 TaxID=3092120 RepID=UPI002ADF1F3D|nr:carbonic anhydrase [Aquicoccus sp. G2-2]MEA1114959.1 carbonic anhydrase [Aquicoccus sp. G2-2]